MAAAFHISRAIHSDCISRLLQMAKTSWQFRKDWHTAPPFCSHSPDRLPFVNKAEVQQHCINAKQTCLPKIWLVLHGMPASSRNIPLRINSLSFLPPLLYPRLAIHYTTKAQQTTDQQVAVHNKTSCLTTVTSHWTAAAQQKRRTRPLPCQPSTLSATLNASQKVVLAGTARSLLFLKTDPYFFDNTSPTNSAPWSPTTTKLRRRSVP